MDINRVQRNIDPAIRAPGDAFDPGAGVPGGYGTRSDIYGKTFDTYFTLDRLSPSLRGLSPADILVNNPDGAGPGFHPFAQFFTLGLQQEDQINSIALDRAFTPLQGGLLQGLRLLAPNLIGNHFDPNPFGRFQGIDPFNNAGPADLAMFSLDPSSPTLSLFDPFLRRTLSAADLFLTDFDGTFALFASAESLGLLPSDAILGLDTEAVPEPGSLPLLFGVLLACASLIGRTSTRASASDD